jgi:hypothetical protein
MRVTQIARRVALSATILVVAAMTLPLASLAVKAPPKPKNLPRVTTGPAQHILGTSALLTAAIDPSGKETTYFFQYGLTTAYGLQTPAASAGVGTFKLKYGAEVKGLTPGATYHYRVVASNANNRPGEYAVGRDRIFATKGSKPKFVIPRPVPDVFGSPYILSGNLSGYGGANHRIALQASPYNFLEPFTQVGLAGTTNASGNFSFRITNLTLSTQFRVVTLDPLPIYSSVVTVPVSVHVILKMKSGRGGLVRLYGTISPAVNGARVSFQVLKAVRPGKSEVSSRYVTEFLTSAKREGPESSRFSLVVKPHASGRYRAYVKVTTGGLASGASARTFVLHGTKK